MKRIALLLLLGPIASACASAQAKAPVERPALEMPPVPPRVIDASIPESTPPEPVGDLPVAPAPAPPPRARNPPASREVAKPDPKPEAPPQVEQAATAVPPAAPVPQLRTPGMPEGPEAVRQVRTVIERARGMLKSINHRQLPSASQAEYNSATVSLTQSEEALKTGKVDIALNLAEKAERIAKELQTR